MSVPPSPDSSDAEQGPRLSRGARKGWWWGWLHSEQQQKLCHFRPDTATVHAQVDRHKDLRLRSASLACADDSQADAQAQRYWGLADDAGDGLETLPPLVR